MPEFTKITEPGVYDIPVEQYHLDPVEGGSLSSTGTKKLIRPSCPALFKTWRDGPAEHKRHFDFGRAAHRKVLGVGDDVAVISGSGENDDWRTNVAKAAVAEAREAGKTPIKPRDAEKIDEMAAALQRHEIASTLLRPGAGKPEQTLVWQDEETGVWRRSLLDWLPNSPAEGRRMVVPDYKSLASLDSESVARALADNGYDIQGRTQLDAVEALGLAGRVGPAFVLIMQQKEPPYLVVVAQLGLESLMWAHERIRHALHLYRWCTQHNHWPGYADHEVLPVEIPAWARVQHEAAFHSGAYDIDIDALHSPQLEVPTA